jgi:hypothetical protein
MALRGIVNRRNNMAEAPKTKMHGVLTRQGTYVNIRWPESRPLPGQSWISQTLHSFPLLRKRCLNQSRACDVESTWSSNFALGKLVSS